MFHYDSHMCCDLRDGQFYPQNGRTGGGCTHTASARATVVGSVAVPSHRQLAHAHHGQVSQKR